MKSTDQLIQQFVEDPDRLSKEELASLAAALDAGPNLARELKEQLILEELLAQAISVDRLNFEAQVHQRIRDRETGTLASTTMDVVDAMQKLDQKRPVAMTPIHRPMSPSERRRWLVGASLAATVLLLVTVGLWIGRFRQGSLPVANLKSLSGQVTVFRAEKEIPAHADMELLVKTRRGE